MGEDGLNRRTFLATLTGAGALVATGGKAEATRTEGFSDTKPIERSQMVLDQEAFEITEKQMKVVRNMVGSLDAAFFLARKHKREPDASQLSDILEDGSSFFTELVPGLRRTSAIDALVFRLMLREMRRRPDSDPVYPYVENAWTVASTNAVKESQKIPLEAPNSERADANAEDT